MSTTTLTEEITESIKKNLPAQVGEALRTELTRIPKLEEQLRLMTDDRNQHQHGRDELRAKLDATHATLKAHGELTAREAAVLKREQAQNLNDLRVELADERRKEVVGLVSTIFRSPITQRSIFGSTPVAVEGNPGNPQYGQQPTSGYVSEGRISLTETQQQV